MLPIYGRLLLHYFTTRHLWRYAISAFTTPQWLVQEVDYKKVGVLGDARAVADGLRTYKRVAGRSVTHS